MNKQALSNFFILFHLQEDATQTVTNISVPVDRSETKISQLFII